MWAIIKLGYLGFIQGKKIKHSQIMLHQFNEKEVQEKQLYGCSSINKFDMKKPDSDQDIN